jgi:hypothetical protein
MEHPTPVLLATGGLSLGEREEGSNPFFGAIFVVSLVWNSPAEQDAGSFSAGNSSLGLRLGGHLARKTELARRGISTNDECVLRMHCLY